MYKNNTNSVYGIVNIKKILMIENIIMANIFYNLFIT